MAQISGAYGCVTVNGNTDAAAVSTVTNWTLDDNININSYNASNTAGYSGKLPGLRSHACSFSGLGGVPPVKPGQRFTFLGFVGPADGNPGHPGTTYRLEVIASTITINFNYGDYSPISWKVDCVSNYREVGDELTQGTATLRDLSLPPVDTMIPSGNCTLKIGDRAGVCLENATLTFTTNIIQFANSCTGGFQSGVAGATSITLTATCDSDEMDIFDSNSNDGKNQGIGSDVPVTLYVEGGDGDCSTKQRWEFNSMIIGSLSGLNVDIAGGGVVNFSVNMEFNAFPRDTAGKATAGSIKFYRKGSGGSLTAEQFYPASESIQAWNFVAWANYIGQTASATTGITATAKVFTDYMNTNYPQGIPAALLYGNGGTPAGTLASTPPVDQSAFATWAKGQYNIPDPPAAGASDDVMAAYAKITVGPSTP